MEIVKTEEDLPEECPIFSEKEVENFRIIFSECLHSYKEKQSEMSDEEWLEEFLCNNLSNISKEESKINSAEIAAAIKTFDENYKSLNESVENATPQEVWLSDKFQEMSVGMSINEYGNILKSWDDALYEKNLELSNALSRNSDGHIKMSRNLDGNIAEHMIGGTTELSANLQGKNIKIEVRDVFTPNSVDVRAINLDTGKFQNYQLKFGKDAKATIRLIEEGNYNNQQIVVPAEQLEEVKEYFSQKGSKKTIKDHIDAWGAKGKKFTKSEMKELQKEAQCDGKMPNMDYTHYQVKDLAISIGKSAGIMAVQSAAVTTGMNIVSKVMQAEKIDADDMIEIALETGVDTGVKVVTAGAFQVAIRRGVFTAIPKMTPVGIIANVACVGIENIKILYKIATGEVSNIDGFDQMGRVTTTMLAGFWGMAQGASVGASLTVWIPIVGPVLSVATGIIGGMVGYAGGSKLGETLYEAGKVICDIAYSVAKTVLKEVIKIRTIATTIFSFVFN